jgi:hypothetical protein
MKQFVAVFVIALCSITAVNAQTFLDNLRQKQEGQGTITVTQSAAIDELVNGKSNVAKPQKKVQTPQKKVEKTVVAKEQHNKDIPQHNKEITKPAPVKEKQEAKQEPKKEITHKEDTSSDDNEMQIPVIDLRKKVMRKSYKVTGYRIQVFSGGNSRNDRMKAENTGTELKMHFPNEPVYVHFYSPSWKCRMGNYRSYEEASRMLQQVKKLGYRQACIVKGKISVQY